MDAYSVGITIFLVDRASAAMESVSRAMLQAGHHTEQLKQRMKDVQSTMAALSAIGSIGHNMFDGAISAMEQANDSAKDYMYTLNKLEGQGIAAAEMQKAVNAAKANSNRDLTSSYTGNLEKLGDMRSVLGSMDHAVELLPALTDQVKIMRTSTSVKTAGQAEHMTKDAFRALELFNDISPSRSKEFQEEHLDMLRRSIVATNGLMSARDMHGFAKQTAQSRTGYSDEYKYKVAPYIMQETGGMRAGTMNAAVNRALIQGIMTVQAAQNLQRQGLITSHETISKANVARVAGNSVLGREDFIKNPYEALRKDWIPQILAHNPQIAAMKDAVQRNQAIAQIINGLRLNQNSTALLATLVVQQAGIEKHKEQFERIPKRAAAVKIADQSPVTAAEAASTQWKNLMVIVGSYYLPIVNQGLQLFAGVINQVNQYLEANPMAAKMAAAAIAATALVGGVLAVISSFGMLIMIGIQLGASIGVVAAVIAGVVVAISGLVAAVMNWDKIAAWIRGQVKAHMDGIKLAIAIVVDMTTVASQKLMEFASVIGKVAGQIATALSNLHIPLPGVLGAMSKVAETMDAIGRGKIGQDYIAKQHASSPGVFNALDEFAGVKPNYTAQAKAGATVVKHGPVTNNFHISQQPGEDAHKLAERIGKMLMEHLHNGMTSTSHGGGIFESQFHFGGEASG